MRKSITVLMAGLLAIGLLASFAGPVAADTEAEAENDVEIDNDIDQEQDIDQDNEQNGAAVAFYSDAEVDQESEQDADQEQTALNLNDVEQDAEAVGLSFDF